MQFQNRLGGSLKKLFPDKEIFTNAKKLGNIVSPSSKRYLELDFWIPSLKLAVEYQDPHHYVSTWYALAPQDGVLQRDSEKVKLVEERGDTLVLVPCWWDGSEDRLIATIRKQRPDLLLNYSTLATDPIDPEPPAGYFKVDCVPSIGELMVATFGYSTTNTLSWWIAEKYDGLRACWSPVDNTLYSRTGKKLAISLLQNIKFPSIFLDGEIWFGRGSYNELHNILLRKQRDDLEHEDENRIRDREEGWENLRFVVFDSPPVPNEKETEFEKRFSRIVSEISAGSINSLIEVAPIHANVNSRHLEKQTKNILEDGGEGIVLRNPRSLYFHGRSQDLLKFKAERDQEAMVVSIEGENYILQLANMRTVVARMTDKENHILPAQGDIVTFTFSHLSSQEGIPQDAKIIRIRDDMTWRDVVRNEVLRVPRKRTLNPITANAYATSIRHPMGYWTENGNAKIREFFDNFAKTRKFDSLIAEAWYSITSREVLQEGGTFLLYHYKSSVFQALSDVYPEFHFDPLKFTSISRDYVGETRQFFDSFAKREGFDPLTASSWYQYKQERVALEENASALLQHFSHSLSRALTSAYPELHFDSQMFGKTNTWNQPSSKKRPISNYWFSFSNRKLFFDNFAQKRGFDPRLRDGWEGVKEEDLLAELGGSYVLRHYGGLLPRALRDIYG